MSDEPDKKKRLSVTIRSLAGPSHAHSVDRVFVTDYRYFTIYRDGSLVILGTNEWGGESIRKAFANGTWLTVEETEDK